MSIDVDGHARRPAAFGDIFVLGLFALSGALGLGYQVLWSKYLGDFIGVSAYSYAVVLAAFMGGLALGSKLLGYQADRVRRPLRLFAALEFGIGLYALAYAALQGGVAGLYGRWIARAPEVLQHGDTAWPKALAAGLLLLPPTVLMGGTYAAVVRQLTSHVGLVGRRASQAYAVNAAGAACGSLLVAFLLLPALGLGASLRLLGALNLSLALSAWVAAWRLSSPPAVQAPTPGRTEAAAPTITPTGRRLVAVAILTTGFLGFSLELAWTRFLSLVLGSSTHSFALMLAAFVGGIALGSTWLARREATLGDPLTVFGWTQLLAGGVVLLPLPLYQHLPWLSGRILGLFSTSPEAYGLYTATKLGVCLAILLPPTALLGMALPLVVKSLADTLGHLGRRTGTCYAWNTTGNVAGALLTGLWLLPALGMERLFRVAALATALLGFLVLFLRLPAQARGRQRSLGLATALVALLTALQVFVPPWNGAWFTLNPFRRETVPATFAAARELVAQRRVLVFRDDPAAHLMVYSAAQHHGLERILLINGKPDASSHDDMPTQVLCGQLPLLLHPGARRVLVVGLASGITAAAVATHPVERVDVVEIVRAMPAATRHFDTWNADVLSDPRLRLINADAREVLAHAQQRYDVIISEPSNPWMAGTAGLFTHEFFGHALERLENNGLYLQWLQAYELDDDTLASIVRTFRGVFPYVYGFQGSEIDLLLLGSRRALQPDWPAVLARFGHPAVKGQLERIAVADLAALLALQRFSPVVADLIAARSARVNTADNLLLEHRAPRLLFSNSRVSILRRLDERRSAAPTLLWSDFVARHAGQLHLANTVKMWADNRIRDQAVATAWTTAALRHEPDLLARSDLRDRIPLHMQATPPVSHAALAAQLGAFSARRRYDLVEAVLSTRGAALLVGAALSPEAARLWIDISAAWSDVPPLHSRGLRRFRVELLLAARRLEAAAAELTQWIDEPLGPHPAWASLRACQIDPGTLCARVRQRYASAHGDIHPHALPGS